MIIVKLKGGLGNQMFQYAFGRRISLISNKVLKLDINGFDEDHVYERKYILDCFNIEENIATEKDLRKARIFTSKSYIGKIIKLVNNIAPHKKRYLICEKQLFVFDSRVLNRYNSAYINGSWQNEKYFKDIQHILRKDFTFNTELNHTNKKHLDRIVNSNSVGLHVRNYALRHNRTVNNNDLIRYGMMPPEYYQNALKYIAEIQGDLELFIFSDDIAMAKKAIQVKYPTTFMSNVWNREYEDMQLMSLCKHQVISNSTFSWWAAWLNSNPNKIIIAPKNWFANADFDTSDLIPYEWIEI